jgi:transcriptional regulator with XRE-family HTH domain
MARARSHTRVQARSKGEVDPELGKRIRSLRLARRMTQEELAGGDFSKGYISLVETGRTRVSLRAAGILARRLGVPLSELVGTLAEDELELWLVRGEKELASGNALVAIELAARYTKRATGLLRARFQRLHGRALTESSRSPDTVGLLDEALRYFRAHGERALAARTVFDLAVAHARLWRLGEALNLTLEAERAIADRDVVDRTLELQIHSLAATVFVALGDIGSAELRAQRALAIAQDVADPATMAQMYSTLSFTRHEEGDLEGALDFARRSLDIYDTLGRKAIVAEAWLTVASIEIERKRFDTAADAIDRARSLGVEQAHTRLLPMVEVARARLALQQGHLSEALAIADAITAAATTTERPRAFAFRIRAESLVRSQAPIAEVREAFERATAAAKGLSNRERATAHESYASALAAYGEHAGAYEQAQTALALMRTPAS